MALGAGACLFNLLLLPRIGGRAMWRSEERARGIAPGILYYPLAVLLLILVFRHDEWIAAAVWGILAFGDGAASLIGQALGGPHLPWNPRKSWTGFLAFVLAGTAGAAALAAWTQHLPVSKALAPPVLGVMFAVTVLCALVESVPTTLDDNITVPLVGASLLALAGPVAFSAPRLQAFLAWRLVQGLAVNGALAAAVLAARSLDWGGAVSAVVIGTAITVGLGLPGLAVMIAFFVVGSTATKVGYRRKAVRGIAQEKGGARGWRNAWANGGVAALLALLSAAYASIPGGLDGAGVLAVAYAAAVATAAADTCSSEIGKAYGRRTFLLASLKPVPPGTEGAVSLEGTLGGLTGAAIVAAIGAWGGLYPWSLVGVVAVAGLLGSLAESLIGSLAERRGWLDNDQLNAVNTALGALFVVALLRLL